MYQSSLKSNRPCDSLEDITQELPRKKTGRTLLIGEELDRQVQEYIREARKRELAINASTVICTGHGIMMNKHANRLNDVHGEIKLTKDWAKNFLRRMGFVKRKACSRSKINVEDFDKVKKDFWLEVKSIVMMDETPKELIINFDQTALNYVSATPWTMEKQGTKRIEVIGKGDK